MCKVYIRFYAATATVSKIRMVLVVWSAKWPVALLCSDRYLCMSSLFSIHAFYSSFFFKCYSVRVRGMCL